MDTISLDTLYEIFLYLIRQTDTERRLWVCLAKGQKEFIHLPTRAKPCYAYVCKKWYLVYEKTARYRFDISLSYSLRDILYQFMIYTISCSRGELVIYIPASPRTEKISHRTQNLGHGNYSMTHLHGEKQPVVFSWDNLIKEYSEMGTTLPAEITSITYKEIIGNKKQKTENPLWKRIAEAMDNEERDGRISIINQLKLLAHTDLLAELFLAVHGINKYIKLW